MFTAPILSVRSGVQVIRGRKKGAIRGILRSQATGGTVKVLREGNPDAELDRAISRLVSSLQFVPARVGDAPVAVSVVWLLERTTVRGET